MPTRACNRTTDRRPEYVLVDGDRLGLRRLDLRPILSLA